MIMIMMIMSMIMIIQMIMMMTLMCQDLERVGGGGDLRERHSHSRFRSSWTTNCGYDDDDNFVDNHADDDYEDDDSDIKARR